MKRIYTARDAMEAHFVRNLLEQEGVPATVLGEALTTARGELPLTQETLPSVWVDEKDHQRALGLLGTRLKPGAPQRQDRRTRPGPVRSAARASNGSSPIVGIA